MLYIDSDNALGSLIGDIDDGFAVAACLASKKPILALGSVGGNARATESLRNLKQLANLFQFYGPVLLGGNPKERRRTIASHFLTSYPDPYRILALGPLTNVAQAISVGDRKIERIVMVGSYLERKLGWLPNQGFNFSADPDSFQTVLESDVPIVILPLDVSSKMRIPSTELVRLPGSRGEFFRLHAQKWWRRTGFLGDLVAAMYEIDPTLFTTGKNSLSIGKKGRVEYGSGSREVEVIKDFAPDAIWSRFVKLFEDATSSPPTT